MVALSTLGNIVIVVNMSSSFYVVFSFVVILLNKIFNNIVLRRQQLFLRRKSCFFTGRTKIVKKIWPLTLCRLPWFVSINNNNEFYLVCYHSCTLRHFKLSKFWRITASLTLDPIWLWKLTKCPIGYEY